MKKVITKIEAQKKKTDRVSIFINEEFAFGCSSELIYYHNLSKGKEVDEEELSEIVEEDNYITAKNLGLKYVESSLKTEFQVKEYLVKKEYNDKVIDKVISFLKEYKFLDDNYYANAFAKQYINSQGRGNIKFKLMQKGISEEIIENALCSFSREQEESVALKLAEKRALILCKKENDKIKVKAKLNSYLLSKGYDFETVSSIIRKINLQELIDSFKVVGEIEIDNLLEEKSNQLFELAQKRYDRLKTSESDRLKIRKKLQDFLLRKGYNYDEIKSVMNIIIEN